MTNIKCPVCGCWYWGEVGTVCKGSAGGWGDGKHDPVPMVEKDPRSTNDAAVKPATLPAEQ
jgi:hypothetical protein